MTSPLSQVDLEGTIALLRRMVDNEILTDHFDMSVNAYAGECGSVACIGGWSWLLKNAKPIDTMLYRTSDVDMAALFVASHIRFGSPKISTPLGRLFFPPDDVDYSKITPDVAIAAIEVFIATGDIDWIAFLAERRTTDA